MVRRAPKLLLGCLGENGHEQGSMLALTLLWEGSWQCLLAWRDRQSHASPLPATLSCFLPLLFSPTHKNHQKSHL